jgi:hypothetical protein
MHSQVLPGKLDDPPTTEEPPETRSFTGLDNISGPTPVSVGSIDLTFLGSE